MWDWDYRAPRNIAILANFDSLHGSYSIYLLHIPNNISSDMSDTAEKWDQLSTRGLGSGGQKICGHDFVAYIALCSGFHVSMKPNGLF